MDSLFFNITERRYRRERYDFYDRVDISNGILFFETKRKIALQWRNFDRMVLLVSVLSGSLRVCDRLSGTDFVLSGNTLAVTARQDLTLEGEGHFFILCIADFFLKRYLSGALDDPVDYLYDRVCKDESFAVLDRQPVDALTLYLIDKIVRPDIGSLQCEHEVTALMIHRFSLLDIVDPKLDPEEVRIASRAKKALLENFVSPPTIPRLAHLCATNETKLKHCFKKVYKTTIHNYVRKLRLEEANHLMLESNLTIHEIANRVGYRHQGYFSRLFFENFGVHPKELIQKNSFSAKRKFRS